MKDLEDNPLNFLEELYKVKKNGGEIVVITGNTLYWVWFIGKLIMKATVRVRQTLCFIHDRTLRKLWFSCY